MPWHLTCLLYHTKVDWHDKRKYFFYSVCLVLLLHLFIPSYFVGWSGPFSIGHFEYLTLQPWNVYIFIVFLSKQKHNNASNWKLYSKMSQLVQTCSFISLKNTKPRKWVLFLMCLLQIFILKLSFEKNSWLLRIIYYSICLWYYTCSLKDGNVMWLVNSIS